MASGNKRNILVFLYFNQTVLYQRRNFSCGIVK